MSDLFARYVWEMDSEIHCYVEYVLQPRRYVDTED